MKALIRHATESDIGTVAHLWTEASAWLRDQGSDQWQYPVRTEGITAAVQAGACWLIEHDGTSIGTITLDGDADPMYWGPEDNPESALYAHRMVTAHVARGLELGSAMLDWASQKTQETGRTWLRLDAWRTNMRLREYYASHGFELVRVIEDPRNGSGACFQRPAHVRLNAGPIVLLEGRATAA